MISWIAASLLVIGFLILIKPLGVIDNSLLVLKTASDALRVLTDKQLDDYSKEKILQKSTLLLFKLFFIILAGSAASVALPAVAVWLFHATGIGSWQETLATTTSWQFIAASSVVGCLAFYLLRGNGDGTELR